MDSLKFVNAIGYTYKHLARQFPFGGQIRLAHNTQWNSFIVGDIGCPYILLGYKSVVYPSSQ